MCSALLLCSVPCSARADTRSRATPSEWATPAELPGYSVQSAANSSLGVPFLLVDEITHISNTISYHDAYATIAYRTRSGGSSWYPVDIGGDGYFRFPKAPDDYYQFIALYFVINSGSLPPSGNYRFQVELAPEAGGVRSWSSVSLEATNSTTNAANIISPQTSFDFDQDSFGSVYLDSVVNTLNYSSLRVVLRQSEGQTFSFPFSGNVDFAFTRTSASPSGPDISDLTSSADVQANINNTVSSISSGVSEVSDRISELIQTIINQLDALWNQFSGEFTNMFTAWNTHVQTITNAIQNQGTTVSDGLNNVVDQVGQSSDEITDNADRNTEDLKENEDKNTNIITEALSALGNFIIEGLKSLFIPSDDFFQNWYTDLYNFFNDRLGLFMLPIDIVIQLINVYINTDSSFAGIPFPEFKWIDGTVIIPAQTVNFTFLETDWGQDIQEKIYFVTDIFMIFSLLVLLKKKLDEVFVQ